MHGQRERNASWLAAAAALVRGAVIARDSWPDGRVVFAATSGTFRGANGLSGVLDAFLVERRPGNRYALYTTSGDDMTAEDWVILRPDYMQRTMPTAFAPSRPELEEDRNA